MPACVPALLSVRLFRMITLHERGKQRGGRKESERAQGTREEVVVVVVDCVHR